MRILALIAARGGSKRLPGKNIRPLAGRPLITWSIVVAQDIPDICDILVSTDNPAIADVARRDGAMVPWLRPDELASDTATAVDVCLHALDSYESQSSGIDGLLLLQPTSPLRCRETVKRGIDLFSRCGRRPVIGVSPAISHPMSCFQIVDGVLRPFLDAPVSSLRSQDLPVAYVVNGAFYLITPGDLRTKRSFYGDDLIPLIMDDPKEAIDIDTEWDWAIAEMALLRTE